MRSSYNYIYHCVKKYFHSMIDYGIVFASILTVLIEYVVLRCLGERRRRVLGASVAINILTNVPLNLYLIHNPSGMPVILLLEGIVMAIEAAWYYLFVKDLRQAAIYSVLCNAISFLIGILIESILVLLETI